MIRCMQKTIDDMLPGIDRPNYEPAIKLLLDLRQYFPKAMGSTKSHHAWEGGYIDHVQEVMNLAHILYRELNSQRKLPFSLSSALLVLFLHDCEKPFRHADDEQLRHFDWIKEKPAKSNKHFQQELIAQYGFTLNDAEQNALKYVEGEAEDYVEGRRTQGPLAAFCHVCDTISARIWFNEPKKLF